MSKGIPPYTGLRDAAGDGTSFPVDPADGVAAMRVIEAVRTPALEHRVVLLGGPR